MPEDGSLHRLDQPSRPRFGQQYLEAVEPTLIRQWQNQLASQLGHESAMACRSVLFRILLAKSATRSAAAPTGGARLVHVWSTRHRNRAVRNGLQRCIIAQVAAAILRKQAPEKSPDKDEITLGPRPSGGHHGVLWPLHSIMGAVDPRRSLAR